MRLEVENYILTIQSEHSHESFLREVRLPAFVNARAAYRNGMLTISFRKRPETRARRILIEVA